ncbi:MAG: c-type cytochrome [Planctomycetes bacterium]|nr:c-type cytochrome [Planctomycetota bacterium]
MPWRACARIFCLLLAAPPLSAQGYPPDEAPRRMEAAPGFEVQLVASEPLVRQPVAIDFDERGRLWVIQYLQYPNPAGLKRVKVDRYSRTVYDRVPEPPPRGPRGDDRITILEDSDGDGRADGARDFVNGLNLASGMAFGHGGVFVAQAPYLLFYPDRDRDDAPDGDPEVCLSGFGMEDASSVINSLAWGPDGWLYGAQGSTVTAEVRGVRFQQGVWRYHPLARELELFHEGGGNTWGLDFGERGELLVSTNVGGYVLLHGVQGGYYWKQFDKHGPFGNPHAYGHLEHAAYKDFRGGHVAVGGVAYLGETFPERFRGKYLAANLLSHAVHWHDLAPRGSTFEVSFGGVLLDSKDTWFAPSDASVGPDGALYVADFHDVRTAHPDPDAVWDRSNGRIYRIAWRGTPLPRPFDLARLSSAELAEMLGSRSAWHARKAREILAARRDPSVLPALRAMALEGAEAGRALAGLWALAACGGFDDAVAEALLRRGDPSARAWAVRLLGDARRAPGRLEASLLELAHRDPSPAVRSQLASTARRLPGPLGLSIASALAMRGEDLSDPHVSLLLWWAVEAKALAERERVLELFARPEAWRAPVARGEVLPRLARRYAAEGSDAGLEACARLLAAAPYAEARRLAVEGIDLGLSWRHPAGSRGPLLAALEDLARRDGPSPALLRARARLGSGEALAEARALATQAGSEAALRLAATGVLGESRDPAVVPVLLEVVERGPEAVAAAALAALARHEDPRVPAALLARLGDLAPALRPRARAVLFARREWARLFLDAVERGAADPKDVPVEEVRRIAAHGDEALDLVVRKHWGRVHSATSEERLAEVRRLHNDLRAAKGDPARGRALFLERCGTCHRLFGEGGSVGPDLTAANRADRDFLLVSIVDPSAQVRPELLAYAVETLDGRVLSGLLEPSADGGLTLVASTGERTAVPRSEVRRLEESDVSLMPEGLLEKLSPEELRDLFAHLERPDG